MARNTRRTPVAGPARSTHPVTATLLSPRRLEDADPAIDSQGGRRLTRPGACVLASCAHIVAGISASIRAGHEGVPGNPPLEAAMTTAEVMENRLRRPVLVGPYHRRRLARRRWASGASCRDIRPSSGQRVTRAWVCAKRRIWMATRVAGRSPASPRRRRCFVGDTHGQLLRMGNTRTPLVPDPGFLYSYPVNMTALQGGIDADTR